MMVTLLMIVLVFEVMTMIHSLCWPVVPYRPPGKFKTLRREKVTNRQTNKHYLQFIILFWKLGTSVNVYILVDRLMLKIKTYDKNV